MAKFNFPNSPSTNDEYTANGVTWKYDGGVWRRISGVGSTQGAQGVQGAPGAQGNQGVQGAVGNQGVQGTVGAQGVQGAQGHQGHQGVQGAVGNQGVQGAVGAQGNPGAQGAQGHQGHQGRQGAPGAQGSTGAGGGAGAQGYQGVQGAVGAQGAAGAVGAQGAQGVQGAVGAQGAQGHQGVQGATGSAGAQGAGGTATINNNADNRIITGSATAGELNGEADLTYDGTKLKVSDNKRIHFGDNNDLRISHTNATVGVDGDDSEGTDILAGGNYYSLIEEDGAGPLIFKSDGGPSTGAFQFYDTSWRSILKLYSGTGARVALHYAGVEKLITDAGGISITGGIKDKDGDLGTSGQVLSSTGTQLNWVANTAGAQGSTGSTGAQGHQGVQGATGSTGGGGSTGAQGHQGVQGATGSGGGAGAQGHQGVQGATGSTGGGGSTGAQGHQGHQGRQGATGSGGSTGAQGHQGVQGAAAAGTNGIVKEVQVGTKTSPSSYNTTGQAWVDCGLSKAITISSGNDVLINCTIGKIASSDWSGAIRLLRGSTAICIGNADGNRPRISSSFARAHDANHWGSVSLVWLDVNPGSGSHTYKIQVRSHSNAWVYVNRGDGNGNDNDVYAGQAASAIVLMEIE